MPWSILAAVSGVSMLGLRLAGWETIDAVEERLGFTAAFEDVMKVGPVDTEQWGCGAQGPAFTPEAFPVMRDGM